MRFLSVLESLCTETRSELTAYSLLYRKMVASCYLNCNAWCNKGKARGETIQTLSNSWSTVLRQVIVQSFVSILHKRSDVISLASLGSLFFRIMGEALLGQSFSHYIGQRLLMVSVKVVYFNQNSFLLIKTNRKIRKIDIGFLNIPKLFHHYCV